MKMICPKCHKEYRNGYRHCPKCAIFLQDIVKKGNRCSNPMNDKCAQEVYKDDDIVCGYCGSDTTYEKERKEKYG